MVITCSSLCKNFRNTVKQPGIRGAIRSFFKREYRSVSAVRDFDLEVRQGEFVALLGPNGAGKTTLMKMCTGIIVPTSGSVKVLQHEPFQRPLPFRRAIALVMGNKSQLWWDIPAMDSFLLLQRYYEIPSCEFDARLRNLAEVLTVSHLLNTHVRRLSLGERMKMELMACLLHQPAVVFLDEPTIGLDLMAQKQIRLFLKEYQEKHGTTIILTSHYMADVEELCKRVVLITDGKKRYDGPIAEFENLLGKFKLMTIEFSEEIDPAHPLWTSLDPQWDELRTKVELKVPHDDLRDIMSNICRTFPVTDFSTEKLPIERVMRSFLSPSTHEMSYERTQRD